MGRVRFNADTSAAFLHATSAFLISVLSEHSVNNAVEMSDGVTIQLLPFAAFAAFWSALLHSFTTLYGCEDRDPTFNWMRWADYSVSSALMVVPAAAFAGQRSVYSVYGSVVAMTGLMVLAAACELMLLWDRPAPQVLLAGCLCMVAGMGMILGDAEKIIGNITFPALWAAAAALACAALVAHACPSKASVKTSGLFVTFGASVSYASLWGYLITAAEKRANQVVAALLVGSHALFAPLFYAYVADKPEKKSAMVWYVRYDGTSSMLSVFCKVLMHWLVFFNDPAKDSKWRDPSIFGVVLAAAAVSFIVGATVLHEIRNT